MLSPDPLPDPRLSVLRKFRQIMKLMSLFAIVIAAIAVLLVARGNEGAYIRLLITTALGAGLSVLLAGALMSLVFLTAGGRRDAEPKQFEKEDEK